MMFSKSSVSSTWVLSVRSSNRNVAFGRDNVYMLIDQTHFLINEGCYDPGGLSESMHTADCLQFTVSTRTQSLPFLVECCQM